MNSEILVATKNQGKLREYLDLLAQAPLAIRSLNEFPDVVEIAEVGDTFTENAVLKAKGYAQQTGLRTLADDSGLEVEALGGEPGLFSARYGGPGLTASDRLHLLLKNLEGVDDAQRRARFVCVIAVSGPDNSSVETFTGVCAGKIAKSPRGSGGFGYDPVFIPDGYSGTFGTLSEEIKQAISHRAKATMAAREFLLGPSIR